MMTEFMKYPFLDLSDATRPFRDELVEAARRVIDSGRYVGGDENLSLESELSGLTGATHAIGVSNGLDALRLTLRAAVETGRLAPGDKVAVAANTFIASVLAISDAGLTPLLIDPDETTMNISSEGVAKAVAMGARAVMPVHLYGCLAWDEEIAAETERSGLFLIEDAAQAIGASRRMADGSVARAGSLGDAAAFSFYPTKNVGALGDGGAATASDEKLAQTIRTLANYGSDRRYHNVLIGFNCRLDPIQAAFIRVKLAHTDRLNEERRKKACIYNESIVNPAIVKPAMPADPNAAVWHQYVVRTDSRDRFRDYLAANGVGTDIHYPTPPHMQPCYASLAHGPLPVAERLAATVVSLPIAESTSTDDARIIAEIINSYRG